MAFIAGCQVKSGNINCDEIGERLRRFQIVSNDDLDSYQNLITPTAFGYIVRKFKTSYPVLPGLQVDPNGNTLVTLGFLLSPVTTLSAENLKQYEGEFVAVLAEKSGTLHIVNDRFASRPFYLYENEAGTYFSSNLAFLLCLVGGRHEADVLGWLNMFSIGHTYGTQTPFKGVTRLPPATHICISPNGTLNQKRYWQLEYSPDVDLDPLLYSKRVFEAFREGASRRSKLVGKGIVALSGGLDSRLVAAAIPTNVTVEFSAFTVFSADDGASSPDTDVAAQVALALGLKHRIDPLPKEDYSATAADVTRLTGGMRPLHHAALMPYVRELKRCGVNFLLGGGPGDVSAGSKIPSVQYLDPARTRQSLEDFCLHVSGGSGALGRVFRQDIVRRYEGVIYQSLIDSFADIGGPTAAHRVTAWELLNRWPAFTFTSVMHSHPDVGEAFCHLDYEYADLMLKLPADWLYLRNFYSVMIYNCLPNLRQIPYANTGQLLGGQLQQFDYRQSIKDRVVSATAKGARRIVPRKIKRLLKPLPKGPQSLTYFLYRNDARLLSEIRECISALPAIREILDADKCFRLLDDFRNDTATVSYDQQTELIGSLASMCLAFRELM